MFCILGWIFCHVSDLLIAMETIQHHWSGVSPFKRLVWWLQSGVDPGIICGGDNLKKLEKMTSAAVGRAEN